MSKFTRTTPPPARPVPSGTQTRRILLPGGGILIVPKTATKEQINTELKELAEKERREFSEALRSAQERNAYGLAKAVKAAIAKHEAEAAGETPDAKPKYETITVTDIAIGATEQELAQAQAARDAGEGCPATVNTYKVGIMGPDGPSVILVEALSSGVRETGVAAAIAKAKAAGYKVSGAGKKMTKETVTYKKYISELEPVTTIIYEITLPNGKKITFDAVTEEEAIRAVEQWGAVQGSLKAIGGGRTISTQELKDIFHDAAAASPVTYLRALIKYRQALPEDQRPPEGAIVVGSGKQAVFLLPDSAALLRTTKEYKTAKGSDEDKLRAAFQQISERPKIKLASGEMPKQSVKDARGNVIVLGWNDVPERYQAIGQSQGYEAMMTTMATNYNTAIAKLEEAGIVGDADYTIPALAKFARDNPNGKDILEDCGFSREVVGLVEEFNKEARDMTQYIAEGLKNGTLTGGESQALARALENVGWGMSVENLYKAGAINKATYDFFVEGRSEKGASPTVEAGLFPQVLYKLWQGMSDDEKVEAGLFFDQDYTKGSRFSSFVKGLEYESQKGPWQTLIAAVPVSVLSPFGKEATMTEARQEMDKRYGVELTTLGDFVKEQDGYRSFDIDAVKKKLDSDPTFTSEVLDATGYESKDKLLDNLEYFNYATHVAPKEWAVAGLVGALTVLSFGGGAFLASTGAAGKVATSFLGNALPVTLGALCLPDTIKLVKDPDSPTWLKGIAVGGTALMFTPLLGPAIRGTQFAITSARRGYVPLRSMSVEASTARVPFTDAQIARLTNAGLKAADIMDMGTKIVRQLLEGNKVAIVEAGGVRIRVTNVQYQRLVGKSLFNSSPDGTLLARGAESQPIWRAFFTEAKVAIEPLERSYLTGQRATKPTINEVRISDPELIARLFPQKRLIGGGKVIEPEAAIPTLDDLAGMGYRLEPIPGRAGRGVTFDASLGKIDIRRYTLVRITENPTGLVNVTLGRSGNGGVVAIGDLHGMAKYSKVFDSINEGFKEPVIKGDPNNPSSWAWAGSGNKGRSVVSMGDLIDRGPSYTVLRDAFNRLHDQAKASGDSFVRLVGNHELAYISGDVIKGGGPRGFPEIISEPLRAKLKAEILADIKGGYAQAAFAKEGKLFTHAGLSKGVFGNLKGKSPDYIASWLNKQFLKDIKLDNFSGRLYAKGRVEKGSSLSPNERTQGGVFWLRPQETKAGQLDWGFTQVVGHNPGWAVRRIWGSNFIETDIGAVKTGKVGAFIDTPYMTTKPASILTEPLGGTAPVLSFRILTKLKLTAMRDTIADVFLGWDGRIQAVQKLKANHEAVKALLRELDNEIAIRKKANDLTGIKFLQRMKDEITAPAGRDYLYGGIQFWRDIVMGRQNSVRVLNTITGNVIPPTIPIPGVTPQPVDSGYAIKIVDSVRNQLAQLSDIDIQRLFGMRRSELLSKLDTAKINRNDVTQVAERAKAVVDIVDAGLERGVLDYLDNSEIVREYARRLQDMTAEAYRSERPYDVRYTPIGFDERYYREQESRYRETVRKVAARQLEERIDRYYREIGGTRYPYVARGVVSPRMAITPRTGRLPTMPTYPYAPSAIRTPVTPYPPVPPVEQPKRHLELVTIKGEKYYKVPVGSIAWRSGSRLVKGDLRPQWFVVEAPWTQEKPTSLDYPPLGAKNIGETSPYKTVQMVGKSGAKVPKDASIDLGFVDIRVSDYGQKIAFAGKGLETSVGQSLASPTVGMSVPATPAVKVEGYRKLAFGTSISSLVMETYREEIPKKFAEKALAHKLSKMAPKDIAKEIKGASARRKAEIFKMLPDRVRKQVELWASMTPEYAPTRGWPKAPYIPGHLRRKKKKTAKVFQEAELVASAAAIRG